jgi:hypothetical protein
VCEAESYHHRDGGDLTRETNQHHLTTTIGPAYGPVPSCLLPAAVARNPISTKESTTMAKTPRRLRRTPSGSILPRSSDGRSKLNRRFKELTLALESDLRGVTMTTALRATITAAVVNTVALEKMRDDLAEGLPVDMDRATSVTNNLESTLRQLEAAKHAASATAIA